MTPSIHPHYCLLAFKSSGVQGGAICENRSAGQGPMRSKPVVSGCLN
jgi:hypothetical protein